MAVDSEGISRAIRKEMDNQHQGKGKRGFDHKWGTKGTGRPNGNGTQGGGINRSVRPSPQN